MIITEKPKYGTIERKIDMMKYICLHRNTTMSQLAEMFGVSLRTVMRDIDDIGDFIPIISKQGRYDGGISVMTDFSWDKAYMSDSDIELLKEIQKSGSDGRMLKLSGQKLSRLDKIIKTYSKNKNFNHYNN